MQILLLILLLYILLRTALEWSMPLVLTSYDNLRVYARHQTAMPNANRYSFAIVGRKIGEKYSKKPFSIIHFTNNHIKTLYAYFANFKCTKERVKIYSICGNMDYLYV